MSGPDTLPPGPPPAPAPAPGPAPAPAPAGSTRELRDRIQHLDDAEAIADRNETITADTTARLIAFRNSVRAQRISLSFSERTTLRGIVDRLHRRTREDDYRRLREELTEGTLDAGVGLAQRGVNGAGEVLDKNPTLKFGVFAGIGVAAFLLARRLWNGTRTRAAAAGTAVANGARATGRGFLRGASFLKKMVIIAGVAVAGAVGYQFYRQNFDNTDVSGSNPEDGRRIRATMLRLTNAMRTNNTAERDAALAELSTLAQTNPTLVPSVQGRTYEVREGTNRKTYELQYDPAARTFSMVEKAAADAAEREARQEITALGAGATADQVIAILTAKAGLPARTNTVNGFITEFSSRLTVGGKAQLLQFNAATKTFHLVEKEKHDKGIADARATLAPGVTYAAPADWSNALNGILAANGGDLTIQSEMIAAVAAGKTIAGKTYLVRAQGANQFEAFERTR